MSRPRQLKPNGNFYLIMRSPADLVRLGAPVHVKRSLGTRDENEAKVRHAELLVRLHREWDAQRKGPQPVPHAQLVALAGLIYREFMDTARDEPGSPEMWDLVRKVGEGAMAKPGGAEQWYGPSADKVLSQEAVVPDAASRARLLGEVHRAVLLAAEQRKRQAEGDYGPDPHADRFPQVAKEKPEVVTVSGLLDLWEREHLANGGSPATPRDHRQKLKHLIAYLSHDDANRVTPKDISDWCDKLQHEEGKSAKTVADKYLSAARAVFGAGVAKFKIASNPAALVRRKVPKRVKERPAGFTDDEADTILRMALVADTAEGREPELTKLAFKWVPWLCAYTGARGGEIAQLRGMDFIVEYGVQTIRITPEAGTVKTGEYRHVPLHPHLIELGILDMVKRRGDGPLFYTPNEDPREPNATQWGNLRAKVGEWVRHKVGIKDERLQPNHAWRHRFKTVAHDVGIDPRYIDVLQGHADGSASADYGERTARALGREIRKLPRYLKKQNR
jgi:integrase